MVGENGIRITSAKGTDPGKELDRLKKRLPVNKNVEPRKAAEHKENGPEEMKGRVSVLAGEIFGDVFKDTIRKSGAFKKDAERRIAESVDDIKKFVLFSTGNERWYLENPNDLELREKIKECVAKNILSINGIGKNKTLKLTVAEFVDDLDVNAETKKAESEKKEVQVEDKRTKAKKELEERVGKKYVLYRTEKGEVIKILGYGVAFDKEGKISETKTNVHFERDGKKDEKMLTIFRDIMRGAEQIRRSEKRKSENIPAEIEEEFHLFEKWISEVKGKAVFQVADYDLKNGKLKVEFNVERKIEEREFWMTPEELRQTIQAGRYYIENIGDQIKTKKTVSGVEVNPIDSKNKDKPVSSIGTSKGFSLEETFEALQDEKSSMMTPGGKDFRGSRKTAAVVLDKAENLGEFNAESEKEGNEKFFEHLKKVFVEMGLAVHGMVWETEKNGQKDLEKNFKTDLDGKTVLFLLKKIGIKMDANKDGNVEFLIPGEYAKGKITADSGRVNGVDIKIDQNESGEAIVSLIFDHHGDDSPRDTSASNIMYQTFKDLGLFQKSFEKDEKLEEDLDKLIELVNQLDNLDYPNGKEYFGQYFENSWDRILGISRMLNTENILAFLRDGHDPTALIAEMNLNKGFLKKYGIIQNKKVSNGEARKICQENGINFKEDGKGDNSSIQIEKISKQKQAELQKKGIILGRDGKFFLKEVDIRKEQNERVKQSAEVLNQMEKDGFIIESERFGKIAIDIGGKIPTRAEAVKAFGCRAYIYWKPEFNRFTVNTLDGTTLADTEGQLLANKYNQGAEVRNVLWIKSLSEKDQPLTIKLEDILRELTDGKFVATGKLKDYLEVKEISLEPETKPKPDSDPKISSGVNIKISPELNSEKISSRDEFVEKTLQQIETDLMKNKKDQKVIEETENFFDKNKDRVLARETRDELKRSQIEQRILEKELQIAKIKKNMSKLVMMDGGNPKDQERLQEEFEVRLLNLQKQWRRLRGEFNADSGASGETFIMTEEALVQPPVEPQKNSDAQVELDKNQPADVAGPDDSAGSENKATESVGGKSGDQAKEDDSVKNKENEKNEKNSKLTLKTEPLEPVVRNLIIRQEKAVSRAIKDLINLEGKSKWDKIKNKKANEIFQRVGASESAGMTFVLNFFKDRKIGIDDLKWDESFGKWMRNASAVLVANGLYDEFSRELAEKKQELSSGNAKETKKE